LFGCLTITGRKKKGGGGRKLGVRGSKLILEKRADHLGRGEDWGEESCPHKDLIGRKSRLLEGEKGKEIFGGGKRGGNFHCPLLGGGRRDTNSAFKSRGSRLGGEHGNKS